MSCNFRRLKAKGGKAPTTLSSASPSTSENQPEHQNLPCQDCCTAASALLACPCAQLHRTNRDEREGRKKQQERGEALWLPCSLKKDLFLAYAVNVLVQTAHEQDIPKLLIYFGVPKKHKHKSYTSEFPVLEYLKIMQPHQSSLATAVSAERRINSDNSPSLLSNLPSNR